MYYGTIKVIISVRHSPYVMGTKSAGIFLFYIDGYAPFASMTSRDTHINLQDTSIAAPGPGQYDNHMIREHVKVGPLKHIINF